MDLTKVHGNTVLPVEPRCLDKEQNDTYEMSSLPSS